MSVLLIENKDYKRFFPVARTKFLWEITCGIFTPYQRYEKQFHDVKVYSKRFEEKPYSLLKDDWLDRIYTPDASVNTVVNAQFIPFENLSPQINRIGVTRDGKFVYLRLEEIKQDDIELILDNDIKPLLAKYKVKEIDEGIFLDGATDLVRQNSRAIEYEIYLVKSDANFISPNDKIYIDKNSKIQQFVSLQTDNGPIVIDKGAVIRSFSIIDGPAYIGKNTVIDSAKVRGGTTIKDVCRIGGEVEESIVESYSNKHHEGFLGHSYVGCWVNIGAMTTTSDLKNNYSNVRIVVDGAAVDTGTNKFGSIICNYSKLGIGLMLNTGTIISEGCNLFLGPEGKAVPKFVRPFSWGTGGRYEIDRFIGDLKLMMERRNVSLSDAAEKFLRAVYKSEKPDKPEYPKEKERRAKSRG